MATDREKAIDLIQKLSMRTRDNGATASEAEAAAAEVQRLLTKFNLSLAEAQRSSDNLTEERLEEDANDRIVQVVSSVVTEFYFVQFFSRGRSMFIFGERQNVEVARYIFQFLHRTFSELCVAELGRHIDRRGIRCYSDVDRILDPYCKGLGFGLAMRLRSERKKFTSEEQNALVVINQDLRDEVMRRNPDLQATKEQVDVLDPATIRGMEHGLSVQIREGVAGPSQRPERIAIAGGAPR